MNINLPRTVIAASILSSLLLGGCAANTANQPLRDELRSKIESTETIAGIKQNELYAAINPSVAGSTGAAACGAIPGIGILLAGVCGGIAGAADASINASRAKEAEVAVGPLRDMLLDFNFDTNFQNKLSAAIASVPKMGASKVTVIKTVANADYDKAFKDATANAVLFVTTDYRMSPDFSTLVLTTRNSLFPRAPLLRAAAGQQQQLQPTNADEPLTHLRNAIYTNTITYEARLPSADTDITANVAMWKADNAALLRKGLNQGIGEISAALALDLQHTAAPVPASTTASSVPTIRVDNVDASVVARSDNGTLARLPVGTLKFVGQLAPTTAMTNVAK